MMSNLNGELWDGKRKKETLHGGMLVEICPRRLDEMVSLNGLCSMALSGPSWIYTA